MAGSNIAKEYSIYAQTLYISTMQEDHLYAVRRQLMLMLRMKSSRECKHYSGIHK